MNTRYIILANDMCFMDYKIYKHEEQNEHLLVANHTWFLSFYFKMLAIKTFL
jgi:hypothetical protein